MDKILAFEGVVVRVVVGEDGAPWFRAGDVCAALGLDNTREAMARLRDSEKTKKIQPSVSLTGIAPQPEAWFVSEPGVYRLVLRSNKPEAERFQDWIVRDVLPEIRRTGAYQPAPETREQLVARALVATQAIIAEKDARLAIAEPKAAALDQLADCEGLMGLMAAAKQIGAHPRKWVDDLKDRGDVYYLGGTLTPSQEHINAGRMHLKTRTVDGHVYAQAMVTASGLAYFTARYQRETRAALRVPRLPA